MLVISRKTGEGLRIGDNIILQVVSISGDKVTLAIDAPKDITIMRDELIQTIEANQSSSQIPAEGNYSSLAEFMKSKKV